MPPATRFIWNIGIRYLEIITAPDALGIYRLVVAESATRKELAELFWRQGPANARALFTKYLAGQARRGTLRLDAPEQAARQFVGMLQGTMHMECLLGLRVAPTPEEMETPVRSAVTQFLDGCRGVPAHQ